MDEFFKTVARDFMMEKIFLCIMIGSVVLFGIVGFNSYLRDLKHQKDIDKINNDHLDNILKSLISKSKYDKVREEKDVFKGLDVIDSFLKSMRVNGYFGDSPQSQIDLDKQQEMILKIRDIYHFIESKTKSK